MPYTALREWPRVSRNPQDILRLFESPLAIRVQGKSVCGLDLEFQPDTNRPTILGLSDGSLTVSVAYADGINYFKAVAAKHRDALVVGHNLVGADCEVLAANGIHIKLDQVEDTIIRHWLVNPHLCAGGSKSGDDEDGGRRGGGWMNLQTFSTLYTDLPCWKECTESECAVGTPCKIHSVFGYNGIDALAPVLALPHVRKQSLLKGVEKLYPLHRDLMNQLATMQKRGLPVDLDYVKKLQTDFAESKKTLEAQLPFNPKSSKQVVAYFKEHGVPLEDNTEETVLATLQDYPDNEPLGILAEFKAIGKGVDSWYGKEYVASDGCVHPRLNIFTSTGRMACKSPNWQNIPARRKDAVTGESFKNKIRRAVIAPEGYYLMRADLSNGENRVMLYHAGYPPIQEDLHQMMADNIGFPQFVIDKFGSPRNASKSIVHALAYAEGLSLLSSGELSGRIAKEEANGARVIFRDWQVFGKTVSFTGGNLAERIFGSKSWENRKKALAVQELYFNKFPKMRDLQRKIMRQVETEHCVRPPHGYCLNLYGDYQDQLKTSLATYGSQPLAHITKLALLKLEKNDYGIIPALQIHDEIIQFVPDKVPVDVAAKVLTDALSSETPEMPGMYIPSEVGYSTGTIAAELSKGRSTTANWADTKKI